jgi:M6 family metalloprotease-like protein
MRTQPILREGVLVLLTVFSAASAAPPDAGPPGGQAVRPYIPNAGYLRTTKELQLKRRAVANSAIPLAPGQPLSIRGTRSIPVVCVAFKNVPAPFPASDYQKLLFGNGQFTMTAYYRDISRGRFNVTGNVLGWYTTSENDSNYEGANNGLGGAHFGDMLEFAFTEADKVVDFGQFDNDGPDGLPNSGDDDGIVDTIFVIHPEIGAECRKAGQLRNIWSHSWHFSEGLGRAAPFATNDPVKDSNGDTIDRALIKIDDYTVQPGLACSSSVNAKKIIEVGVFCHEYGHALGLPDLYDRTPNGNADSEGVGNWCLMSGGSYGGDGAHSDRPCQMSAWCKYYLGWANEKALATALLHQFAPVDAGNEIYRFNVPGTNKLEYFLIEFRRKKNWDEYVPAEGLAVWHIDERVGNTSDNWPFAPPDEGQNDARNQLAASSPPLIGPKHQMVALIQADRKMQLEDNVNRGDEGDLFKGGLFGDDPENKAGSRAYSGAQTALEVTTITVSPDVATGNVKVPADVAVTAPPAPAPHLVKEFNWNPSPSEKDHIQFLDRVESIIKTDPKGLTESDRDRLKAIPNHVLEARPASDINTQVLSAAAKARTQVVTPTTNVESQLAKQLRAHVNDNTEDKRIVVRYAPGQNSIEKVNGLSIPIGATSPRAHAHAYLEERKSLFGGAALAPLTDESHAMSPKQTFQQTTPVNGTQLPIFGKTVSLHYSENELKGMTANLANSPPKIEGEPGSLNRADAKAIVSETLGTPADVIRGGTKGVFLVGDSPDQGRIAWQFLVPSGPKQRAIEVYVDQASTRILSIK